MPHAVDPRDYDRELEENDDNLINSILSADPQNSALAFLGRDLEVGEKADDAQDFEDIDDDDLAEDESGAVNGQTGYGAADDGEDASDGLFPQVKTEIVEDDTALDDLFGEQPSSPVADTGHLQQNGYGGVGLSFPTKATAPVLSVSTKGPAHTLSNTSLSPEQGASSMFRPVDYGTEIDDVEGDEENPDLREQRLLFRRARTGAFHEPPPPPQNDAELFEMVWPQFEADKPPHFGQLLPGKRAFYLAKTPIKPPKPVQPTKVNLDLQQDQERSFRIPGAGASSKGNRQAEAERVGVIKVSEIISGHESSEGEMDLDVIDENEDIGGVRWQDLAVLCEDWDTPSLTSTSPDENNKRPEPQDGFYDEDDMEYESLAPPAKKRKTFDFDFGSSLQSYDYFPSLEDPEQTTARLAKTVSLDMNDPELLLDEQQPSALPKKIRRAAGDFRHDTSGTLTRDLSRRYNIANDDAYDALKENHQHKVRSTLGNLTVEHSLPALKLQYPFYKVKLSSREARSFHRPALSFRTGEHTRFSKNRVTKRKHLKGKDTLTIFNTAKDLSMGDNSNVLLFEYSEEYPTMLSNFGMGNRLINYHRRKDTEDNARPKLEIGETAVLLTQDKSPFSVFGDVEKGEIMPTLHNGMFRAPVFKQDAKHTDFLVIRSTTGTEGTQWFMRNIGNLYVVGQEFPSVEVPGTHSRKVTEAAKRRLKAISYRIYSKKLDSRTKGAPLTNERIRQHLPGTDIAQNRGKMREFMAYNKDAQSWEPKRGEVVPDAATIRGWIKPEDICLLDSMQVGHRHLQDAGYNKDEKEVDGDEDEERDGQSIEQQLAPWQTTKNFLNACQGKAMLQLHGEGDPSGRGEAFSFIKTSMKGGFKAIGESVEDKLDAKKLKELGGHSYNVARQQKAYEDAIKRVWEAQKSSLSATVELSDAEMDDDDEPETTYSHDRTPRSGFGTPAASGRRDDDTMSQFSRFSASEGKGKILKIVRVSRDKYGTEVRDEEIVRDARVMREYVKRRRQQEFSQISLENMEFTGDKEKDAILEKLAREELARLERNKERRHAREKAKGIHSSITGGTPSAAGSPSTTAGGTGKTAGTQRKCANCGQVGHIKTNKKYATNLSSYHCRQCTKSNSSRIKHTSNAKVKAKKNC
ncbi:hypothetical protein LTR04_000927 [Oleoguttula sp. CCFEE 6159]|nr:hypothetical protein LTR04_000927 [Oleoguttula sp. CCFEE 6159]